MEIFLGKELRCFSKATYKNRELTAFADFSDASNNWPKEERFAGRSLG
jgi:hypothetical protein